jgi:undecaprenyl diphosphate synthase
MKLRHYDHVSLLPDGNGRWALQRGLSRSIGHAVGAANFIRLLPNLAQLPIDILSVYLFSTENWKRSKAEIARILGVIEKGVINGLSVLMTHNIRFRHIGELAGLPESLQLALLTAIEETKNNDGLLLVIAINYGGRYEIINATRRLIINGISAATVDEQILRQYLYTPDLPDPEIIIRTGGDRRLSNWMILQTAETLIRPVPVLWPDFTIDDFCTALWTKK